MIKDLLQDSHKQVYIHGNFVALGGTFSNSTTGVQGNKCRTEAVDNFTSIHHLHHHMPEKYSCNALPLGEYLVMTVQNHCSFISIVNLDFGPFCINKHVKKIL